MQNNQFNFEAFLQGYLAAALWSSIDEDGNHLDENYDEGDIHPAALAQMKEDCLDFMQDNLQDLLAYMRTEHHKGEERAGHDFWLTRKGHGCGFWDRSLGKLGDRLTKASKPYSSCDLYVGDDGMIHI